MSSFSMDHEVRSAKMDTLDALDRLLATQPLKKSVKIEAIREVAEAATRMVKNLEQWEREKP